MKQFRRRFVIAAALALLFVVGAERSFGVTPPEPVASQFHVPAPQDVPYPYGLLHLHVDATDITHSVFEVVEAIPVTAGPLVLLYPEWIPGVHAPVGPINSLAGLVIKGNDTRLPWVRDPGNVYAFHVNVPTGVQEIEVNFKFLPAQDHEHARNMMTPEMLRLGWNTVALYPAGYFGRDINVQASVRLPEGFKFATALPVATEDGANITFKTIDFENLVDSPLLAGKYYRRIDLNPGGKTPVHLDVFGDQESDLNATPEQIQLHRNMVEQMHRLYGTFHFDHYDFLFSLSDKLAGAGLEHSRSSEDGTGVGYFTKWDDNWVERDLLVHEFNHSWDGKYRRPAALWTPNFNETKRDHGLWVYEGFTEYNGYVVAARSGLWSKHQALEILALLGATYDEGRPGISWRNILDTTNNPILSKRSPIPYLSYQLSEDYYFGGQLTWTAVDAKIRELTHDKRTLDNFARDFFGVNPGAWNIDTYGLDDVVSALDKVAPFDWSSMLNSYIRGHGNLSKAFDGEGWRLIYNDQPNDTISGFEKYYHITDLTYSIGLDVDADGRLGSMIFWSGPVLWNGPAFKAGVSPSMVIKAVNGVVFTPKVLKAAIVAAAHSSAPIRLLVQDFNTLKTIDVDYHGGLRYPHLERVKGTPDYLSEVLAPLKTTLKAIQ